MNAVEPRTRALRSHLRPSKTLGGRNTPGNSALRAAHHPPHTHPVRETGGCSDPANRLDWVQYANGTKTDPAARDALGREIGSTWRNTATNIVLTSETSTLDLGSQLTDLTTDGNDPRPSAPNYLYDAAGRLTDAWTTTRGAAGAIGSQHSAYGFSTASASCAASTQAQAGKNTNRTSQTIGDGGTAVSTSYCYDAADRLVSTTAAGVGAPSYDSHGNTTTLWGEDRGYDSSDRHSSTVHAGTTVAYTRDATDRIIAREVGNPATETERYGFTGEGDTPALTLDATNTVTERTMDLPGGASVTYRGTDQVWSLTNLHGDTTLVTDATGTVQGPARTYDPYGNTTGQPLIDNSAGAFDYAWLGEHQRPTEHETGLAQTIEMGARQYDPTLGRFLETDPLEGGSANDYDYVNADPVNGRDLDGNCGTWGNPWKKCGRGHRRHRGFLGGVFTGYRSVTRRVRHRWKHDTTSAGGCWMLACVGGYTYRNSSGHRRWKLGVQVGLAFPGPYVSSSHGRPRKYPSASWSVGYGACVGRSSHSKGWNFTLGTGHCTGIWAGP